MRHGKLSALARAAGLCLLGLALGAGASTGTTLTGMTVSSEGDLTRIHVMLDKPVEWSHFALGDPARLFVDCRGVDTVLPKTLPQSEGRAGKIEASVWKGEGYHALTRITVNLTQASAADIKAVEDGLLITLGPVAGGEWTLEGDSSGTSSTTPTSTESTATATAAPSTETGSSTDSSASAPSASPVETTTETTTPTESTTPAETTPAETMTPAEMLTTPTETNTPTETATPTEATSSGDKAAAEESPRDATSTSATTSTAAASAAAPEAEETPSETVAPTAAAPETSSTPSSTGPAPVGHPISAPDFESELTPAETMAGAQATETVPETPEVAPAPATTREPAPEYSLPSTYADAAQRKTVAVKSILMSDEKGLAARGGARVSLDIQGADIYTVLRSISEYSGVNIVMGYDVTNAVKDPVSFHLESVPWGEALEMVLRSAHLWYREEGNVIRVDTEENLRNEELARSDAARKLEDVSPLTTRIVEVIYANARELKGTVEKSLSRRGVVEVDERSNSLVITDIRSRVEGAVEMVQHLDSQTPQVEIVAKLVDVDAQESRELGVLWSGNNTGSNGDITINGPTPGNSDALLGFNKVADPALGVRFGLVKSWGEVNATISALEKENKANIISNPRITTVNNREARILVGQKIPLIVLDEAGNPVTELTTIGITLRVIPHINDQKRITLDLHPEVSDLSSQATVQGGVIINTSEADTRVMVGNGETAVIGGLIRTNEVRTQTGVPILMDIPLIGAFFSQTGTSQAKRELLIFVTPRIIDSFSEETGDE